jgi:crotonobetainyl-CoA:carnitine CoA-transferase CaiB-like acyl-CoA transferase
MSQQDQNLELRPLFGVRVLDLAQGVMAMVGRTLGELGADVIRLEPAQGSEDRRQGRLVDGLSVEFAVANLGKRSAPLDRFEALSQDADIVIAPAGAIDVEALQARSPRCVVLSLTDFDRSSQFGDWTGSEAVFHALTGQLSRSGLPDREPLLPPGHLAQCCAAMQASFVLLTAYYNALKTGQGDRLDFAILDGAFQSLDPAFGTAGSALAGAKASTTAQISPVSLRYYPIISCADGYVRLCLLAPKQWRGMFEWMGSPEAFADARYDQLPVRLACDDLIPAITDFFADKTRAEIEAASEHYNVPAAALMDLQDATSNVQTQARRAFASAELAPGLEVPVPQGLMEIDGERMAPAGPPPGLPVADVVWLDRPRTPAAPAGGERPLSGLKVLDFGVIIVGAETGRALGDQGADVIKVENSAFPDGGRANRFGGLISPNFVTGHRNKRSLGLNVRDPRGKALLLQLVRDSDVVLGNFRGGVMESLGLDYASLKSINPRIIVVDSNAFGSTGPWAKRMGYGPLVRASAGLTMQWCYPGEADSFSDAVTVFPDHVAARIGCVGVLSLLIRRLRTGVGGAISISQAEVMLSMLAPQVAADAIERAGRSVAASTEASTVYPCAGENQWCAVTTRGPADAAAIQAVAGGQSLVDWLAEREPRTAMQTLQAAGVPAAAVLSISELEDFAYYADGGLLLSATHPHLSVSLTVEGAPVRSQRMPAPPQGPAPLMGEHTIEILRERTSLPDDEIQALIEAGVLEQFKMPDEAST